MAVQTLHRADTLGNNASVLRRTRLGTALRTVKRSVGAPPERAATESPVKAAKLEEVEDRLIADALDAHPHLDTALDGALDDMAAMLTAELHGSRRGPLLLRSTRDLNRVEDLLLDAIVRAHPNREHALDHLLDDIAPLEVVAAAETAERTAARFDMQVDNDFDGMS